MTSATILGEIHGYIRDQVLSGQDDGLSATTRLLELGILDSFGLFKLVAHLNERYAVDIKPGEIVGHDFKDLESIARLVSSRLATMSPGPAASLVQEPLPEGVAVFEAPACAQVFVFFTGLAGVGMPGRYTGAAGELADDSPQFFARAGLGNRNILLFHDKRGRSYKEGVSAELPTRAAIQRWVRAWIGARPQIVERYCIGVSAGGPMAMFTGDLLGATTVWAFAPRTARGNLAKAMRGELAAFLRRVTGKAVWELEQQMTPEDQAQIDANLTPAMIDNYYRTLLDPEQVLDTEHLAELVNALTPGNGRTEHRVYYVPGDACDALVANTLAQCPRVTPVTIPPSDAPEPTWAFSRWIPPERWVSRNHLVVDLLRERGIFGTLFPPFRAARAAATV